MILKDKHKFNKIKGITLGKYFLNEIQKKMIQTEANSEVCTWRVVLTNNSSFGALSLRANES